MALALTLKERTALRAVQRQQGRQWRLIVADWWSGMAYYGTATDADTLEGIKAKASGDASKLPNL